MIASLPALAAAAAAGLFFTLLGLPLARRVAPAGLAPLGLAPILGWAVFSALALPVLTWTGFGPWQVRLLCAASLAAALLALVRTSPTRRFPCWAIALAALLASLPMLAILPKPTADGWQLALPMFDHAKIALVDGILRNGLPVRNPFLGGAGTDQLSYYYLWHFSAAVLAGALGTGGWAADAALTGFTAFASLLLMMALALAFGGRALACAAVALLSFSGTVRPVLDAWFGGDPAAGLMPRDADLGGWLVQAAWVPQHLASAACVVLAGLLLQRIAEGSRRLAPLCLGLVAAAGFESSTWVGGVAFALAAPAAGLVLLLALPPGRRLGFVAAVAGAGLVALVLVLPFVLGQLAVVADRAGGAPIALTPYPVLGTLVPEAWRRALDIPAFWLLLLPAALPAIAPLGALGLARALRRRGPAAKPLAAVLLACLAVAWLLRSTIANNDLGWRAVVPAILLLTAFAAATLARLAERRRWRALVLAAMLLPLGLPDAANMLRDYAFGRASPDAAALADSGPAWDALRRLSGPAERVVSHPLFAGRATPWPVNIAWALLADRPSCFAGWETVVAYGNLPIERLQEVDALVIRSFDGQAAPDDVSRMAWTLDCRVALLRPSDGAWGNDPFAASADFTLAEATPGWRIYRRRARAAE